MKKGLKILSEEDIESLKQNEVMLGIYNLLNKHKNILQLLAQGNNGRKIGKIIYKSHRTIENDVYKMCKAVEAKNRTELIAICKDLKII